mmetsp:Transcript_6046/g.11983  ORF Transcript_6046/g.11983 Transcript_6046/m.11983 type:complete len:213 (+) Transcript_6046:150-788(+)
MSCTNVGFTGCGACVGTASCFHHTRRSILLPLSRVYLHFCVGHPVLHERAKAGAEEEGVQKVNRVHACGQPPHDLVLDEDPVLDARALAHQQVRDQGEAPRDGAHYGHEESPEGELELPPETLVRGSTGSHFPHLALRHPLLLLRHVDLDHFLSLPDARWRPRGASFWRGVHARTRVQLRIGFVKRARVRAGLQALPLARGFGAALLRLEHG